MGLFDFPGDHFPPTGTGICNRGIPIQNGICPVPVVLERNWFSPLTQTPIGFFHVLPGMSNPTLSGPNGVQGG